MNEPSADLMLRLRAVDDRLAKRDRALAAVYGILLLTAPLLFILFPFPLSRIGSVVIAVGFAYMISRCSRARRQRQPTTPDGATALNIARLDHQIEFAQSLLFNVPFFVGANLFWMGLPGTGSPVAKAVEDFVFLAATALVFCFLYVRNQQTVRQELIPLRNDLQRVALDQS